MPSSEHYHLSFMTKYICECNPQSVLDVGVGYGKWGFLVREYLEVHANPDRTYPGQWKVVLEGVEVFLKYIVKFKWLKLFYNFIYSGDICDIIDDLPNYDLIIAADVLEHIPKHKSVQVAKKLSKHAKQMLLVSMPLGKQWLKNRIVAGNPHEEHLSAWTIEEARSMAGAGLPLRASFQWTVPRGPMGAFVFSKKPVSKWTKQRKQ